MSMEPRFNNKESKDVWDALWEQIMFAAVHQERWEDVEELARKFESMNQKPKE